MQIDLEGFEKQDIACQLKIILHSLDIELHYDFPNRTQCLVLTQILRLYRTNCNVMVF